MVMITGPLFFALIMAIVIVLVVQGMLLGTLFQAQILPPYTTTHQPSSFTTGEQQEELLVHSLPEWKRRVVDLLRHRKKQKIPQLETEEASLAETEWLPPLEEEDAAQCAETLHIPFVIMAFRRVGYMKQAIASILASDFPHETVPIVISHDGHVPEMMEYIQSLRNDSKHKLDIIQLVHPHSCYEHPHSFPGNDTSLNIGYAGDSQGNPRSAWATCCKHHFTWMINTVFKDVEALQKYETFFFLEEDYVVSRRIYSSLCHGLETIDLKERSIQNRDKKLGSDSLQESHAAENGLDAQVFKTETTLDGWTLHQAMTAPEETNENDIVFFGIVGVNPVHKINLVYTSGGTFQWTTRVFRTGPMTLSRSMFHKIQASSNEYCTKYDEYNWDWTLHHLMTDGLLPQVVLLPKHYQLVKHIGVEGMHASEHVDPTQKQVHDESGLDLFLSTRRTPGPPKMNLLRTSFPRQPELDKGFGGWFHPRDMEHCLLVFGHNVSEASRLVHIAEQEHAEMAKNQEQGFMNLA